MSAQQEWEQAPGAVSDRELRAAVEAARARDASDTEIVGLARKIIPAGKLYDIPPDKRAEFLVSLDKIGCPAHFFPIAERLVQVASNHGGKFVLCGFGETPNSGTTLPPVILHLPNTGEPEFRFGWRDGKQD